MPTGLPETLLRFVQAFVPTYQAAEVLLFFAANPGRDFSPEEIVSAMRPVVLAEPSVKEYKDHAPDATSAPWRAGYRAAAASP